MATSGCCTKANYKVAQGPGDELTATFTVTIMHTAGGSCHEAIGANPAWGDGVAFRVTVNR